jgi:hypothetical protein
MAFPTFTVGGTAGSGTGGGSPAWPVGHEVGDIGLLVVMTANEPISFTDAAGFVEVTNSPQARGTAASATAIRLGVFWCRATSTAMSSPVIPDLGNHQFSRIYGFRGCISTGDPYDVTAGDQATASLSVSIPGATTTVADCLVVLINGSSNDGTSNVYTAGPTNADLANLTALSNTGTTAGNGSSLAMHSGEKATAGAYGVTTATQTLSEDMARMSIALKPFVAAPGGGDNTGTPYYLRRRRTA